MHKRRQPNNSRQTVTTSYHVVCSAQRPIVSCANMNASIRKAPRAHSLSRPRSIQSRPPPFRYLGHAHHIDAETVYRWLLRSVVASHVLLLHPSSSSSMYQSTGRRSTAAIIWTPDRLRKSALNSTSASLQLTSPGQGG